MTRCLPNTALSFPTISTSGDDCRRLTTNPLPKGDRVAVLTVSGGAGIWGADTVSMQGLKVRNCRRAIQAQIKQWMPSYGAAGNPIDVTAQGASQGGLQKSIDLLSTSDESTPSWWCCRWRARCGCRSSRPNWSR
jgi:Acyl-CoA synthetase (NDP forming)